MRCPNCLRKLSKEDVCVESEYDWTGEEPKLVAKRAICMFCGEVLATKQYSQ